MSKTTSYREFFPHRKLDVYRVASAFYVECWKFAGRVRFQDYFLRSQFLRAALSIKLNIAEGAGEWRKAEKARIYRIARRSADECAAMLDDFPETLKIPEQELEPFYYELVRICHMLSELIQSMERRASKPRKR